eukprot:TRINITY_DN11187_c0_g1_i1.p1 TRINITY_DN11187_c0_g1~~TRINITY_DN11187_c0_g1_i1.p1  ORF type:complete len:402 (+),score=47.64 TRINITY_DN11187_c0_g1_i1:79-1284(+)
MLRRTVRLLTDGAPSVTPWSVTVEDTSAPMKYDKVAKQFGSEPMTGDILERYEKIMGTGSLHRFIKRDIAFTHRGLGDILDEVEKGRKFYMYTGRGPSNASMHLGHAIPFLLTKQLQDAFNVPLVIQLTDDEKFLFRDLDLESLQSMTRENIKDIMAFGFDPKKTFIFNNLSYMHRLYQNTLRIQRQLTFNKVSATFGFDGSCNIGRISFPAIQAAPCISSSFPNVLPVKSKLKCLIPCAIDQDPFFLLTRDVCPKLKSPKPSLLMTKFLPPLSGVGGKMSSSAGEASQILLTDSRQQVSKKMKRAFSGGAATLEEYRKTGGNPDIDVAFQYLRHFLPDDAELDRLEEGYRTGDVNYHSGIMKSRAAEVISDFLDEHQQRRQAITDADVDDIMRERSIWVP